MTTCLNSDGYENIRNGRKYEVVADPGGLCPGGIVVIDDTGKPGLYPRSRFDRRGQKGNCK
jgi:hypothetical protein